jgi:hypothetical protein
LFFPFSFFFPFLKRQQHQQLIEDAVEEEDEEKTPTQAPGPPNLAVEVLEELMVKQMSFNAFTHFDFIKLYHHMSSKTRWFQDGHHRAISDFRSIKTIFA